jgi:hypothetical protein
VLGSSTTIGTAQTTRDSIVSTATLDRNYRVEVANARHHALAGIDGEHDGSAASLEATIVALGNLRVGQPNAENNA